MRMESPLNQRLRRSPPDVVYTPIDVTSGAFLATQAVSAASGGGIKLWGAVPIYTTDPVTIPPTFTVEASKSVTLDFSAGDTAVLSSTPDGTGGVLTDNFITVNGANVCPGGNCFIGPVPLTAVSPIDVSGFIPIGESTILIEWIDFGGSAESSDIFLVTSAELVICHKGKNTISVSQNAVAKHIEKHGDTLGACP